MNVLTDTPTSVKEITPNQFSIDFDYDNGGKTYYVRRWNTIRSQGRYFNYGLTVCFTDRHGKAKERTLSGGPTMGRMKKLAGFC